MPFIRRREYISTIAVLFSLILGLGGSRSEAIQEPIYDPVPTIFQPEPTVTITPTPTYLPSPCTPGGRAIRRPSYVRFQPVRNLFRFLFTPRCGSGSC